MVLKTLGKRVKHELEIETAQTGHYAICEDQLQRIWPLNEQNRKAKIEQFAMRYGLKLSFYKQGLCAIFEKTRGARRRTKAAMNFLQISYQSSGD